MPFDHLFRRIDGHDSPGYQYLLTFGSRAATRKVFSLIKSELISDPGAENEALALLKSPDWRMHLVAAAAALFLPNEAVASAALWQRVLDGSWAAPQLLVILDRNDPQFPASSEQFCAAVERKGPDRPLEEMIKVMATLNGLLTSRDFPVPDVATKLGEEPDPDRGWYANGTKLRRELAIVLGP